MKIEKNNRLQRNKKATLEILLNNRFVNKYFILFYDSWVNESINNIYDKVDCNIGYSIENGNTNGRRKII